MRNYHAIVCFNEETPRVTRGKIVLMNVTKAYRGVEVESHTFSTLQLDGVEVSRQFESAVPFPRILPTEQKTN